MTDDDRDRGAYSPSGQQPSFDPRRNGYGGAGRPPLTLLISAGILLVLVIVLIVFYSRGVRTPDQPPMVGSSLGEIVQPPPASATPPSDEAAGLQIYKAEEEPLGSSAPVTLAPTPEEPLPRGAPSATPAPASTPTPAPATAATPKPPPSPAPSPGPVSAQLRTTPAPAPARAPTLAPAASSGGPVVQIGALSSPALADKAWNDVAKLMPGDMVGRTKRVEPVASNGATLYRAFVGGFGSKAEAVAFCGRLKAQGKGCLVK